MRRISLVLAAVFVLSVMVATAAPAMADDHWWGGKNSWWNKGWDHDNDWWNKDRDNKRDRDRDHKRDRHHRADCGWYWSWWHGWERWCWSPWFGWYKAFWR